MLHLFVDAMSNACNDMKPPVSALVCMQFADVTNTGFPPIYDKFLSVIGMFSLDLGWILSAACLATGVTFYDKLL